MQRLLNHFKTCDGCFIGVATLFFSLFIGLFILSGCAAQLTAAQAQSMTPEQIKAYSDSGQAVIACIMVGGPPLGGRTAFFIVPKDRPSAIEFSPDCQIKTGLVGTTTPAPPLVPAPIK